ncbi:MULTISPECIES: helix-turn-helix transcriptional regulator [Streptomyces]|uniref:helix-turn-helix transcriptional regulator n=1 Tax=Streptomyces TaxID=1883 RepID=UPI003677A21E
MANKSEFMSPKELAEFLGISVASLYTMNTYGTAPRRIRVGRHIRYRRTDVDAWLDSNVIEGRAA